MQVAALVTCARKRIFVPVHVVGSAPLMIESRLELRHPPIVEAVLDIDCDVPPVQDLVALETPAREQLGATYPKNDRQWLLEQRIEAKADASATSFSSRHAVQALRFRHEDEKQLVQLRALGYSFNRLAPYGALDDYLAEIERTWRIYVALAKPTQVRLIRLRYINRILLPIEPAPLEIDDYLKLGPRLPDEANLAFVSFFNQYAAVEVASGLQVNVTLTVQPEEGGFLPVIFDNTVFSNEQASPENWTLLLERITALRALKNRVFKNTLTERCLELFQTP
jgi:uncharacterized protein (TIGR04255 family)